MDVGGPEPTGFTVWPPGPSREPARQGGGALYTTIPRAQALDSISRSADFRLSAAGLPERWLTNFTGGIRGGGGARSMVRALVFPGQGSQAVGMGRDLAAAFPVARYALEEVDDALEQRLSKLMFEGPESELMLTENAQPALMAM